MIDVSELEAFARKCEAMQADLKPYAGKTLEEIGEEFLDIVQAQIQGTHNVDKGKHQRFEAPISLINLQMCLSVCSQKWHSQRSSNFSTDIFHKR